MTLINLSKDQNQNTHIVLTGLAVVAGLLAFWLVLEYNQMVDMKFEIEKMKKQVQVQSVLNSEYKVNLLNLVSPDELDRAGRSLGLVKEKNPEYYSGTGDVVARYSH